MTDYFFYTKKHEGTRRNAKKKMNAIEFNDYDFSSVKLCESSLALRVIFICYTEKKGGFTMATEIPRQKLISAKICK